MTNKIMQNNSLYNINNNKILQDKLSTMMSTQKKITRPSDDPIIAIRALRLRTTVSDLTQYYGKNVPDAESWLEVTEKALGTVVDVITDLTKQANLAANKEKGPEDLAVFIQQMKQLRDEYYSTGNSDFAGRYVFTGYRTNTSLSFKGDEIKTATATTPAYPQYTITEQITMQDFDSVNYTYTTDGKGKNDLLDGLNKDSWKEPQYADIEEKQVFNTDIHRIRLSYKDLEAADKKGNPPSIQYKDADGNLKDLTTIAGIPAITTVPNGTDPYQAVREDPDAMIFVPETGEILMGDNVFSTLQQSPDVTTTTELQVTYDKHNWKKNDLKPEHYFACTGTTLNADGTEKSVDYNQEYLKGEEETQIIEYDVGYNQKIRVNTTAREAFTHDLGRDIDDLEEALKSVTELNATVKDLEKVLDGLQDPADKALVQKQLDAAKKAYDYTRENIHNMFQSTMSSMQSYLDQVNKANTDSGTRSSRLELIDNRLMDQKATFESLQSENEDIDIAEVIVKLTSTELTYNSALMATGKIMQTSLMNYI